MNYLLSAAQSAPSADNCQPWKIDWDGTRLTIGFDIARNSSDAFSFEEPATLLTMGALVENVVQAADALGGTVSPSWLCTSDPSRYSVLECSLPTSMPNENPRASLFDRHTNRYPYRADAISDIMLDACLPAGTTGTRLLRYKDPTALEAIARLIKISSEVRYQTQDLHEWLARSLRFGQQAASGDGLDVATLGLPPGGRFFLRFVKDWKRMRFMNALGMHRMLATLDMKSMAAGPLLIAIASRPDRKHTLEAGRLMQRAWIALNRAGLAVQPSYTISDQLNRLAAGRVPSDLAPRIEEVFRASPSVFGLAPYEKLQMLLRVGYPTRDPVRSRRLPLQRVFVDLDVEAGDR